MTEIATPGPLPPPPLRSGHGCLWGCLAAALIAIVALVGTFGYLGWYLSSGFKNDATLTMVIGTVNGNQIARSVLGDHIEIAGLSSTSVQSTLATGTTASYVARLKGARAEGTLEATVVTHDRASHITVLLLTGPDGRRYDLTGPPQTNPQDSI